MDASRSTADDAFVIGDWLVEPSLDRISAGNLCIHLRRQLTELLVYLAGLNARVASIESIHDRLWPGRCVSSGTIYNCVAELRCLLGRNGDGRAYIETLPKRGYRLAVPVGRCSRPGDETTSPGSIVVLPPENIDGRPSINILCQEIANGLVLALSYVVGLRVHSAKSCRTERVDRNIVASRFRARHVLSGSLRPQHHRFRTDFRLETVADGSVAWSGRFVRPAADLLDVQDDVIRRVCDALQLPKLDDAAGYRGAIRDAGAHSARELN